MRTLQQIITEITRDAPSARVMGGENSIATMHHDYNDDNGGRITFQRGSRREDRMIVALANFLVLHEAIRDREGKEEK